eukprot:1161038-Pelagomonas_calceolata.AAC.7
MHGRGLTASNSLVLQITPPSTFWILTPIKKTSRLSISAAGMHLRADVGPSTQGSRGPQKGGQVGGAHVRQQLRAEQAGQDLGREGSMRMKERAGVESKQAFPHTLVNVCELYLSSHASHGGGRNASKCTSRIG